MVGRDHSTSIQFQNRRNHLNTEEVAALLLKISEMMVPQALMFRTLRMQLTPTIATVDEDGRVEFSGFDQSAINERLEVIRRIVRATHALGYLFLADGRVTDITEDESCDVCHGRPGGCERCVGTGRKVTYQSDAVHVVRVTRDNHMAERLVVEYQIVDGIATETKREVQALHPMEEEYKKVWWSELASDRVH